MGSEAAKARWEGAKMRATWGPQPLCGSTIADQRLCHFAFTCFSCPYNSVFSVRKCFGAPYPLP